MSWLKINKNQIEVMCEAVKGGGGKYGQQLLNKICHNATANINKLCCCGGRVIRSENGNL